MEKKAITKVQAVVIAVIIIVAIIAGAAYYYSTIGPAATPTPATPTPATPTPATPTPATPTPATPTPATPTPATPTPATPTPTPKIGESIKIGILLNLAGGYAPEGIRARLEFTAWATEINVKGGLYLEKTGAYHPIELIFYDGESEVTRYVELATKMVTEKLVHLMIVYGAPPPFAVPAVINIEKVGGVPAMCSSPIDTMLINCLPSIPGNKFKWTWHASFNYTVYGFLWKGLLSQWKDQITKIGVLYSDDVSGRDARTKVVPRLEEAGFTIVDPGLHPPGITDFTAIITKFKNEGVDLVLANTLTNDWIAFRRQCAMLGFKPKMFGVGRCMKIPEAEALGKELAEGITAETHWWYTLPYKGNEWFKENWNKILGDMSMTHMEGIAYTSFFTAVEALKIAGTLDREAINDAFAKVNVEMPTGRVKFREDHTCATTNTLAQFVMREGKWDMKIVYVLPETGIKTETPIFPMP
jgi:ABC-type branched-subunit amino acid transport system substrate-binding protein